MSEAAEALQRLSSQVGEAADALRDCRFQEFAELAAQIEQGEAAWGPRSEEIQGDPDAEAECRKLRRALDRLGGLLGHLVGVRHSLGGLDPAQAGGYDRSGAGVFGGRTLVREEA